MPPRHGLGDEIAAHLAREARCDRDGEEEPDVCAIARARSLDSSGQTDAPARLNERADILDPRALVEVDREEPASLVVEERVLSDNYTCAVGRCN